MTYPIDRKYLSDWQSMLEALQMIRVPGHEPFSAALGRVSARLAEDLAALERDAGFIFIPGDTDENTGLTVDLLRRWHLQAGSPSLAALCVFAVMRMHLRCDDELLNAVLAAAALGEIENPLPYHNNLHYKKVLLQTIRMIVAHNDIYKGTSKNLSHEQAALLLLAACIHDLGHDGKGNMVRGVFYPGRLERRSFEMALPYLRAAGFHDDEALADVKVMLLCTEVTPLGDLSNPMNQMKAAYRHHFLGHRERLPILNLDPELERLESNAALTKMSLILHEADIATSGGLDYAVTQYETVLFMEESGEFGAGPQAVLDFLNRICQRQMLSSAGQELFGANMARIYALAEEDVRNGHLAYADLQHSAFLHGYQTEDSDKPKTIN